MKKSLLDSSERRALPEHFAPIAMISAILPYDELLAAMVSKMSRLELKKGGVVPVYVPKAALAGSNNQLKAKSMQDGRINKKFLGSSSEQCLVCGRLGHRSREFHFRADMLAGRSRGKGRGFRRPICRDKGRYGSYRYPSWQESSYYNKVNDSTQSLEYSTS